MSGALSGEDMNPTEWAIACGFSRESFAMRLKILVAELCSKHASHRHICMGQLQLDQWPACHSLNLNLWQLGENVRLDPAQIQRLDSASKALPLLQCLHLVGRGQVPLRDSTIEGLLVRLLARHVSVVDTAGQDCGHASRLVAKSAAFGAGSRHNSG